MSEEKSPDWLPAGWTVERKVRKNGKKDMCYSDPLNELKFYSKPEVLRYLKKEQEISCLKSKEKNKEKEISCVKSKEKNEGTSKRIEVNVVVEKTVPEELPPGWIKELKVKKQGHKIRKDPYYTDPVTGYVFRSLKDVNRYLKTGVLGKLAFKPKDDNRDNMELDDEKLTTQAAAEGEKSADGQTDGQITGTKSPKLVETRNDELNVESTDTTNPIHISKNASEQCREDMEVGDVNLPEASGLEAREEKSESTPQNELNEKKAIHIQKKKSSEKSKPSLPRRASKRLAGVEVDLPREPKTRRQAAARQAGEVETSIACLESSVDREVKVITDNSSNEKQVNPEVNLPREPKTRRQAAARRAIEVETSIACLASSVEREVKVITDNSSNGKQVNPEVDLPWEPKTRPQAAARRAGEIETSIACLVSSVEREVKVITDNSSNEKQVNPAVLPHANNFSTLGKHGGEVETYDMPKETHAVNDEKDNKHGNVEADNKPSEKQELPIVLPPGSFPIPEEHGGNVETDNKFSVKREAPVICGIEVETSSTPSVLPPAILSTEEHNKEVETNNMPLEGQELPSLLPPVNLTTLDELGASKVATGNIPNEKQELLIVSPPASLSMPEDYGKNSKKFCAKQELPNVFPPAIPEVGPGSMEIDYRADIKPESPVNLSLTDLWTDPCIEFAVKTLTGAIPIGEENKLNTYSGSPLDLPLGELWTDPCIEFAVKTLTGAIPVGEDLSVQDYFQQHACSSENQGENGFTSPDVGLNNFCQTEFLSQHFNTAENSRHKQQEFVVPMLPNQRNGSLPHPTGGGGLHQVQCVKGNNGECSRKTFL